MVPDLVDAGPGRIVAIRKHTDRAVSLFLLVVPGIHFSQSLVTVVTKKKKDNGFVGG